MKAEFYFFKAIQKENTYNTNRIENVKKTIDAKYRANCAVSFETGIQFLTVRVAI